MSARQILVVDDEVGIRELLRDILQDEGYQVRLAENAAQAREYRQQFTPDLVLLDIWMPDCDGISLLKEWGNSGLLTMPVVMMSGHGHCLDVFCRCISLLIYKELFPQLLKFQFQIWFLLQRFQNYFRKKFLEKMA